MSLFTVLQQPIENLSKAEQTFLDFLARNFQEIPFLSATDIASQLQLNSSGLTRFAQRLGYEGYPALQRQARQEMKHQLALNVPIEKNGLQGYWKHEIRNLEELAQQATALPEATQMLVEAQRVWITGAQVSMSFAYSVAHFLGGLRSDVHLLTPEITHRPDILLDAKQGDVVLAFTVRRYATATRQIVEQLLERGAVLLLITDMGMSPLVRHAKLTIRVPTKGVVPFDSISPVLSLAHALVISCAQAIGTQRLEQSEQLWQEFATFEL